MATENWTIDYFLAVDTGKSDNENGVAVLYVSEPLKLAKGYHQRVANWLDAVKESAGESCPHDDLEKMLHPIFRLRWDAPEQGTYMQLIALTVADAYNEDAQTAFNLPLHPALQTAGGKVLLSEKYPITLNAPDGTKYTATQI